MTYRGMRGRVNMVLTFVLTMANLTVRAWAQELPSEAPRQSQTPADQPRVAEGRYLAGVGNCISCHTAVDGQQFAGGVPFKTPFGTIYSSNITSDKATGIGNWSREQFVRAMREGVRADGEHLYPAFPYPAFTKVSDRDLDAIWAFLRTVPAVPNIPPKNDMPLLLGQRAVMSVWNALFFTESRFNRSTTKSESWNRGAYLVQGLGHCGACHTPRNVFGAEKADLFLSGGAYMDSVSPGKVRRWSTPNLTNASGGLQAWQVDDVARYLKSGHSSRATIFGPMSDVVRNSTQYLTDADARAIALYLKDSPARRVHQEKVSPEQVAAGEPLYTVHCGTCHLPDGSGGATTGPPLVGSTVVQAPDPATLINIVLYGARPAAMTTPANAWKSMEGLSNELSDEEVAAVSNYVRGSWGNVGSAVTEDAVAQQR